MKNKRKILLNPGPVTLTSRVRQSLLKEDLCHRENSFSLLLKSVKSKLLKVYDLDEDFDAVILAGSGTAAVEAMLKSFVKDHDKCLVLSNGVYGERMASMLQRDNKEFTEISNDWLEDIDFDAFEKEILKTKYDKVICVHNETTTGRLNDLERVLSICETHNIPLLLDAVSSFGAEKISFNSPILQAVASTANKCIHGITGACFVIAKNDTFSHSQKASTSLYFDLHNYWNNQNQGWCPFTPSIHSLYALEEALDELFEEGGFEYRNRRYKHLSSIIRETLRLVNIPTLLDEESYSSMISSFLIPQNYEYEELYDYFADQNFIIYSGQGSLAKKIFRICNMGDITDSDLDNLKKQIINLFN